MADERGVRNLPVGTVTLLFTDIEDSTALLESLRDQYPLVLSEHDAIIRSAFVHFHGHEINTQGDSFFASFRRASDAIAAAVEIQRALFSHRFLHDATVKVRVGLHTGEPMVARADYEGMDVHLAARIASSASGGQVLLSRFTCESAVGELPSGVTIRHLGSHKLRGIRGDQELYQLEIAGLAADFPPLKTLWATESPPTPGSPPYMGLQYFDEGDAVRFFGRAAATDRLVDDITRHHFLAVIGASGSGKSSVVRAGLVPALRVRFGDSWGIEVISPTAHPLEVLAGAVAREMRPGISQADLLGDLARDRRALRHFAREGIPSADRLLLVVDQFEELFALCRSEAERAAFVGNLVEAVDDDAGRLSAVITLRADFYDRLAQYARLCELVAAQQEYIRPMSNSELREAIEAPARQGGWEFTPGLVDLILHDLGAHGGSQPEPGALPLLSHALLETWRHRRGNTLTLNGYYEAGGVQGAIARTAQRVYDQELTPEQQEVARGIFLRLTEPGEGAQDTRRRASISELAPAERKDRRTVDVVVDKLAEARLVTLSEDGVEVAHEALIREWPMLREWLDANREGLRLHRQLTEAAHEWQRLDRDPGILYRGARLARALEWFASHERDINLLEQAFLDASRRLADDEASEHEAQRQRELAAAQELAQAEHRRAAAEQERAALSARSAQRLRRGAYGLAVALALVLVLLGAAFYLNGRARASATEAQQNAALADANARQAKIEQRVATARELAAASASNLAVDPERSILLAMQAISATTSDGKVLPEAESALHSAVAASRVRRTFHGPAKGLLSVAVAPDGHRAVLVGLDGTAAVWDLATGAQIRTLGNVNVAYDYGARAAYAPDASHLMLAANDNTARLWDLRSGHVVLTLAGHQDLVTAVAFSADGKTYATASRDKTAKLWDAATGKERLTLTGHTGTIDALALSADGRRVYTGSDEDGTAIAWDAVTGQQLYTFSGQSAITGVETIAVSPDGKQVATGEFDTTVRVWDDAGRLLHTLFGHSSQVASVAYSPDGRYLASGSEDGVAKVWDAATGQEVLRLAGHTSGIPGIAFMPDGSQLITASRDGSARAWDVSPSGSREWLTIAAHTSLATSVAFSPDGTRTVTWGMDGAAKVWDAGSGRLLLTVAHHPISAFSGNALFSPDGKRLGLTDGHTARIVDALSGADLVTFPDSDDDTINVAFSPDGARFAIGFQSGKARLYDSGSGALLREFAGHKDQIWQLTFSPDGARVATASADGTARVWDATSGEELLALQVGVRISGIAFSPDGTRVATASNEGTAKLWDATTGQLLSTLKGHSGSVFGVAFSPDGRLLATTSVDRTVKVWTLGAPGEQLAEPLTLLGHTAAVYRAVFSPDGRRLATASRDGTSRVYAIPIADLVTLARERVTRGLTQDECQKYLHQVNCPAS